MKQWPLHYHVADYGLRQVLRRVPVTKLTERVALWWGYRYRPDLGVAKLRSGARLNLTSLDHMQVLVHYLGVFEPRALELFKQFLPAGGTAIDVGANIGLYSIEAAKRVGPNGRVLAIEPAKHHAQNVRYTAEVNAFRNVRVINCAVGDTDGVATLTMPSGGNSGMFTLGDVAGQKLDEVPVRRIDDIVAEQQIDRVDAIKMDIEGSEYRALVGANATLRKFSPPILIELNEAALRGCGASSAAVKGLLFDHGYSGFRILPSGLLPIALKDEHDCDECLFKVGS